MTNSYQILVQDYSIREVGRIKAQPGKWAFKW